MNEIEDRKLVIVVFFALLLFSILGSLAGYFGLQSQNERLTIFSVIMFTAGILVFVVSLVFPFKQDGFWFSHLLNSLGRIGWLRLFSIGQHTEGAINLALLLTMWNAFVQIIVGSGSYVQNDLSTILFLVFAYSWIFLSTHLHCNSLYSLVDLSRIVNNDQKTYFVDRIKRVNRFYNRFSLIILFLVAAAYGIITTLYIDPQDKGLGRLTFYATEICNEPAFAIAYPPTIVPYYCTKLIMGLTFGFFGVITGLILTTIITLLWLVKIRTRVDIYDSDCIKPAEQLMNTFWLLTGSGLFFLPYTTALSLNLQKEELFAPARWLSYVGWTYLIFFAGFFFFSLVQFFSFVSKAKKPVEQQIRAELKDILEINFDRKKLAAARSKMKLLQEFKGRATLTLLLQLAEIIALVLLNVLIKYPG